MSRGPRLRHSRAGRHCVCGTAQGGWAVRTWGNAQHGWVGDGGGRCVPDSPCARMCRRVSPYPSDPRERFASAPTGILCRHRRRGSSFGVPIHDCLPRCDGVLPVCRWRGGTCGCRWHGQGMMCRQRGRRSRAVGSPAPGTIVMCSRISRCCHPTPCRSGCI